MSIYKEIEASDKVFGRTRKVSEGLFSGGFELLDMYIDPTRVKSGISDYVDASGALQEITIADNGTSLPDDFDPNLVDPEASLEHNKSMWTNIVSGDYYADVHNQEVIDPQGLQNESAESQFTIAYGNKNGYGSLNDKKSTSVTKAIYSQYRNLLLGPGDSTFTFTQRSDPGAKDRDSIYIINFTSKRIKEKFDEGNLEFTLSLQDKVTREWVTRIFRDDSRFISRASSQYASSGNSSGRVFNIIKGDLHSELNVDTQAYANGEGVGADEGFGLAYPDLGIIVLNPYALACEFGSAIEELQSDSGHSDIAVQQNNPGRKLSWFGDVDQEKMESNDILKYGIERNHQNFLKLFHALVGGSNFKSRSTELVPSKHYFIRVKNTDFNYSNNPTYVYRSSDATEKYDQGQGPSRDYWLGRLRVEDFIDDPKTYITTVGLYNENNDLVAVAKLSVPILKSFDTEALIKVKLDF